jgi:hypothetical protein
VTRFATKDGAQALKSLLHGVLWAWRSRFAKSEKQAVLIALYRVKFTTFKTLGICGKFDCYYLGDATYGRFELRRLFRLWPKYSGDATYGRFELRRLFRLWPKYSGDIVYPVPGGHEAFWSAVRYETTWSGEYGKLRKELLNFMIKQLEKELAE